MQHDLKLNFKIQLTDEEDTQWLTMARNFNSIEDAKKEINNLRLTNYNNIVVDYRIVLVQELTTVVYEEQ